MKSDQGEIIKPTLGALSALEWADERLANSVRIAALKVGTADEAGWNEDVNYWGEITRQLAQRELLRMALVKLVGVDGVPELEQMEAAMRLMPAPAEDKAATIDAIHALIVTARS